MAILSSKLTVRDKFLLSWSQAATLDHIRGTRLRVTTVTTETTKSEKVTFVQLKRHIWDWYRGKVGSNRLPSGCNQFGKVLSHSSVYHMKGLSANNTAVHQLRAAEIFWSYFYHQMSESCFRKASRANKKSCVNVYPWIRLILRRYSDTTSGSFHALHIGIVKSGGRYHLHGYTLLSSSKTNALTSKFVSPSELWEMVLVLALLGNLHGWDWTLSSSLR